MDRAFLYLPEVAYILGIPQHAVRRLVRRGDLPTRVERYTRDLQFGVEVVAARIDDDRRGLLTGMVRKTVVLQQVNERNQGVRDWIAERTWPSEGTIFETDLRGDYESWCAEHGYTVVARNSFTWSLERAGHVRRPWTQKPKARWRQYIGVCLRPPNAPRAADRTSLLQFELAVAGEDPVVRDALLRREVVAVPALGLAAGEFHGVDLFVRDACRTGSGRADTIQALHSAYVRWCAERAVAAVPRKYFAELLTDLGFATARGRAADVPPDLRLHAQRSTGGYGEIRLGLAHLPAA